MTELSFAKTFLTTLDSRPTKVTADHVEDPKSYPGRGAYILPKFPRPMNKRQKTSTLPGSEPSLSVLLKSARNPPLEITLTSQALSTSILSLKEFVSAQSSIPVSKIRLLYNKKPVPDSKILKDLLGDGDVGTKMEFGIMVMGGVAVLKKADEEVEPKVVGEGVIGAGAEVLKTEEFWGDLKGFLVQRLKDESEGERVVGVFRKALQS
ncbi:uncharacterized protein LY89DRAFT_598710 [Mollisia scopiformis]|uniref:Ubiquitin-like domain-containing protein n=1 Tax=Mollisia scopiformis TaxID=149040 RepID=A0A132B9I9_MOLSC|nr:uncharacterized protein LY89DRAFT_598710 [Mollisia scopiformis]KUJ09068.1 hypothetical protein LY89DRAFT_598710 [Mollisia scopiformis]